MTVNLFANHCRAHEDMVSCSLPQLLIPDLDDSSMFVSALKSGLQAADLYILWLDRRRITIGRRLRIVRSPFAGGRLQESRCSLRIHQYYSPIQLYNLR